MRIRLRTNCGGRALTALSAAALVISLGTTAAAGWTPPAPSSATVERQDSTLRWTVGGEVASSISIRGSDNAAACDMLIGEEGGCLVLRDDGAARTPTPCQDIAGASDRFEVRCATAGLERMEVVGGHGPRTDIVARQASGANGCSSVPITVTQVYGSGTTDVADGCRQVVNCDAKIYVGRVEADRTDLVAKECAYIWVDGKKTAEPKGTPRPCTCPGGGAASIEPSPSVIKLLRLERGGARATLRVGARTWIILELQRNVGKRFKTVRTVRRTVTPGVLRVGLRRGRKLRPGLYRLLAVDPGSDTRVSRAIRVV